jgi:hypothetical protein
MSQTLLTPQQLKLNDYAVQAGDLLITPVAMDAVNGNAFVATGREILFFDNTDTGAHTITVSSVADPYGRTDTSLVSYSIPAGDFAAIEMSQLAGWVEAGEQVYLATSSALVKVSVLRF